MIGQKVMPRKVPPAPPEFAKVFIEGGWEKIERVYGARTDLYLKWIEQCGGDELKRKRREYLKMTAVKTNPTEKA